MAIYFIRHGQSQFNAVYDGETDPLIFDAPLTKLGLKQATQARKDLAHLQISRVITSPLTRAIQTAMAIFEGRAPIEVRTGHHELLLNSCDVGRSPDALSADFPELSFQHLPRRWWHSNGGADDEVVQEPMQMFQNRIADFVTSLDRYQSEDIAVVGHGNAFKEMTGLSLDNCQMYQFR